MGEQACVYIMASRRSGTIYTSAAVNLPKRVWEHRTGVVAGSRGTMGASCRSGMSGPATWKLRLIEGENPEWLDLYDRIASG